MKIFRDLKKNKTPKFKILDIMDLGCLIVLGSVYQERTNILVGEKKSSKILVVTTTPQLIVLSTEKERNKTEIASLN
jgi:hypothetical protein